MTSPSPQPAAAAGASPVETVLRLRAVEKSFRVGDQQHRVLRGVDLTLRRGEVHFLVGPSGCGKTTLLSVACGTLRADAGEIDAFGHALHRCSSASATRFRARHVGFIFQQFQLIPTLTAWENVSVPLRLQGAPLRVARERAQALLDQVGLADHAHHAPARLSGGQQQRVAIARALVHDPPLVICDEPTSALDSATGQRVMTLLRALCRSSGRSVLVVTHDPRIHPFADRLATMEDGRILNVLEGPFAPEPHPAPTSPSLPP